MSVRQDLVVKTTIKAQLVDALIALFFEKGYIIFGGCVRDYILTKKKYYPMDFDIGVDSVYDANKTIKDALKFSFEIMDVDSHQTHSKMILTHKHLKSTEPLEFIIDISERNVIGSNLDFDVNGIYMPDAYTFKIPRTINISLMSIVNNINKKKFRILKAYKPPNVARIQDIASNSAKVCEYVKMMDRTVKMLNRGWTLNKQNLEDIFVPCLIKKTCDIEEKICFICSTDYRQYELELDCCKKVMCFPCALNHVKARYSNSEIMCPYCRGDPFGWKTNGGNNQSGANDDDQPVQQQESTNNLFRVPTTSSVQTLTQYQFTQDRFPRGFSREFPREFPRELPQTPSPSRGYPTAPNDNAISEFASSSDGDNEF
jgi:hypothetical protein